MGVPYLGEIDWINKKVAEATGLPMKFLYQRDEGREPSDRVRRLDLIEYTKLQQNNDKPTTFKHSCITCGQDVEKTVTYRQPTLSQKMAMSDAWSRELRRKIQESEQKREVQVRVDPYFEDWE